jgi:hypothetical protein
MPVKNVYCAFKRKSIAYIITSRVGNSQIGRNRSQQSDHSKTRLLEQLRDYIWETHNFEPAMSGTVEGVHGSKLYDVRVPRGIHRFGPLASTHRFYSFLTGSVEMSPDQIPEANQLIMMYKNSQYTTCFTHGDLRSTNILVHGDEVVGIMDWDTCGWYPEDWECATA